MIVFSFALMITFSWIICYAQAFCIATVY